MAVTLGSNIASLQTQRKLAQSREQLSNVFVRLSSGMRINRASDDAAGLAIADSLRVDQRVYNQGQRNLSDGTSLLSIADSALSELSQIVTRIRELSEQAANGTLSNKQRVPLDLEAHELAEEYVRIAQSTEFNGVKVFDGSFGQLRLQGGYGQYGSIAARIGGTIGTGTFGAETSQTYGSGPMQTMALGDLDGDGDLDMVAAGAWGGPGVATVRLGDGSGSFGAVRTYTSETDFSWTVELGDLNGDGILDMVTAGYSGTDGYATVRLGDGTGSFGAARSFMTESLRTYGLDLEDVNGDGNLDLLTSGRSDGLIGVATIRLGDGTGNFGAALSYSAETGISRALKAGDVNGDGILDLITAGYTAGNDGYATVRLGTGSGTFGGAVSYTMESGSSNAVELGDINGDGILDMLTAGRTDANTGYATVRLGIGNGTFGAASSYAVETVYSVVAKLADVNGDALLDMVTAGMAAGNDGYATIRLGDGKGSFGAALSYSTQSEQSCDLALGDLNHDGVADLVTSGRLDSTTGSTNVRLSDTADGVGPLLTFSLRTMADARQAMSIMDRKIDQLAAQRGTIGAGQSRISAAFSLLGVSTENLSAAESRIRDTDVAEDAAELARLNILQQAGVSVLAQANLQPQLVLALLG